MQVISGSPEQRGSLGKGCEAQQGWMADWQGRPQARGAGRVPCRCPWLDPPPHISRTQVHMFREPTTCFGDKTKDHKTLQECAP